MTEFQEYFSRTSASRKVLSVLLNLLELTKKKKKQPEGMQIEFILMPFIYIMYIMYLDLANKINHDEKKQLFYISKRN